MLNVETTGGWYILGRLEAARMSWFIHGIYNFTLRRVVSWTGKLDWDGGGWEDTGPFDPPVPLLNIVSAKHAARSRVIASLFRLIESRIPNASPSSPELVPQQYRLFGQLRSLCKRHIAGKGKV